LLLLTRSSALFIRVDRARALCDEDNLQAELMFLRDVLKQNGYNDRQIHRALNRRPHLPQPDNEPNSVAFLPFVGTVFQPYKQSAGPTQHQICRLAPHEIIQSPPSGQRLVNVHPERSSLVEVQSFLNAYISGKFLSGLNSCHQKLASPFGTLLQRFSRV
jgi:hypothetical protein